MIGIYYKREEIKKSFHEEAAADSPVDITCACSTASWAASKEKRSPVMLQVDPGREFMGVTYEMENYKTYV